MRPAPANYANVRRYLGKQFKLSRMATGRRAGQRWTEGCTVRTSYKGVIVDYSEHSGVFYSDGSLRTEKLKELRAYLGQRWELTETASGALIVTDKQEEN